MNRYDISFINHTYMYQLVALDNPYRSARMTSPDYHYYHYNNTGKKQSQCKQDGSNSSESDESGLKALPKKILKSKKCFIKGLLSKLWT